MESKPCIEFFFGLEMDDGHIPGQGEFKVSGLFRRDSGLDTDCCCTFLTFTCTGCLTCKTYFIESSLGEIKQFKLFMKYSFLCNFRMSYFVKKLPMEHMT